MGDLHFGIAALGNVMGSRYAWGFFGTGCAEHTRDRRLQRGLSSLSGGIRWGVLWVGTLGGGGGRVGVGVAVTLGSGVMGAGVGIVTLGGWSAFSWVLRWTVSWLKILLKVWIAFI